ncbi:MAG TPA: YqhA family protein [Longimicrobium sp.]|nr:YqhA family protein [Longimicrobium sp.]
MRIDDLFERFLWGSRLIVLLAVVASLVVSVGMFVVSTIDVVALLGYVAEYATLHGPERITVRAEIVTHVIEAVDGYLLAAIMLIFSLGLYELFVARIEVAEGSELASRLLLIRSLDDLKDRLAKMVLLILVVKFFEYALRLEFKTPLDLLYMALGTVLVAGALFLTKGKTETMEEGTH